MRNEKKHTATQSMKKKTYRICFVELNNIYGEKVTNCNLMTSSVILTFHRVWLLKSLGSITFYTVETKKKETFTKIPSKCDQFLIARYSTRFSVMIHENNLFFIVFWLVNIELFILNIESYLQLWLNWDCNR